MQTVDMLRAGVLYCERGGVPERTIGAALKADEPKGYGGSNPSSSASMATAETVSPKKSSE
jgi:hypothetical protein